MGRNGGGAWGKEGKSYRIGRHETEDEAAMAYNRIATKLYGERAQLNVIKKGCSGDIRDFMIRAE